MHMHDNARIDLHLQDSVFFLATEIMSHCGQGLEVYTSAHTARCKLLQALYILFLVACLNLCRGPSLQVAMGHI